MNPAFLILRRYGFVHVRGSDKIRIAVNEAFYTHLSNRKGLYTNESTAGVSLYISHTVPQ